MKYNFDEIVSREKTGSFKWDRYYNRDILPLWIADMDFKAAPNILKALHNRIEHGVFGYTIPQMELYEELVLMIHSEYDWNIKADWIVWLPSLITGINTSCRTVGNDGDAIVTGVPIYPPFLGALINANKDKITVPYIEDSGRWIYHPQKLNSALSDDQAKLLMFCNPLNPGGTVFKKNELEVIADAALKNGVTICSDEIHSGLILDEGKKHIPIASLDKEIAGNSITMMSPAKTFNIPGMGFGFAIIPNPKLRHAYQKCMEGIVPHLSALSYTAGLAAYRDCKEWHIEIKKYLRGNRDLVEKKVRELPGIKMLHLEATYLAWIDVRDLELEDNLEYFESFGLGIQDGTDFGGDGFVRLNFGCPRSRLIKALDCLEQICKSRFTTSLRIEPKNKQQPQRSQISL